jgi:predicted AlkP superfamily pyrophosphatase or phosphodiesterase
VDKYLGYVLNKLEKLNLADKMNILVVSDHGMALYDEKRFINISNYVDTSNIDFQKTTFSTVSNIFLKSNDNVTY